MRANPPQPPSAMAVQLDQFAATLRECNLLRPDGGAKPPPPPDETYDVRAARGDESAAADPIQSARAALLDLLGTMQHEACIMRAPRCVSAPTEGDRSPRAVQRPGWWSAHGRGGETVVRARPARSE